MSQKLIKTKSHQRCRSLPAFLSEAIVGSRQSAKALSAQQFKEDFSVFKKALLTLHPGIYRYQTPESLGKIFAQAEKRLENTKSEQEFFVLLAKTTSQIKCGHTYLNPDN